MQHIKILREAAIAAIQEGAYDASERIAQLLQQLPGSQLPDIDQDACGAAPVEGEAHDIGFWALWIQERFIPDYADEFTPATIRDAIHLQPGLLTTGDRSRKKYDAPEQWVSAVNTAIQRLRDAGDIVATTEKGRCNTYRPATDRYAHRNMDHLLKNNRELLGGALAVENANPVH
ncbi:MAG: hypothetical protein AAGF24_08170 [Cyanobacteria bacterium P01_H01_bin.121]